VGLAVLQQLPNSWVVLQQLQQQRWLQPGGQHAAPKGGFL
jgi:hypothetical protein